MAAHQCTATGRAKHVSQQSNNEEGNEHTFWTCPPHGWACKVWSSNTQRYYRWNWTKAVKPLPCSTDCGRASISQHTALCYVGTTCLWIWHRFSLTALLFKDCIMPETFCLKSIKTVLFSVLLYTCSHSNHWHLKTSYELYCSQYILFVYIHIWTIHTTIVSELMYNLRGRASDSSSFL